MSHPGHLQPPCAKRKKHRRWSHLNIPNSKIPMDQKPGRIFFLCCSLSCPGTPPRSVHQGARCVSPSRVPVLTRFLLFSLVIPPFPPLWLRLSGWIRKRHHSFLAHSTSLAFTIRVAEDATSQIFLGPMQGQQKGRVVGKVISMVTTWGLNTFVIKLQSCSHGGWSLR
jgi:hypothetical protein